MVYWIKVIHYLDTAETVSDKLAFDHNRQFPIQFLNNSFIYIPEQRAMI